MNQKIKMALLSLSALFMLSAPLAVTATVHAQVGQNQINNALCKGSKLNLNNISNDPGAQACDPAASGTDLNATVRKIINILSVIVGAIAVIMIIWGGFRYVTSAGSDSGVQAAKKTILYALIGLVIVALAQVIVHFVLTGVR